MRAFWIGVLAPIALPNGGVECLSSCRSHQRPNARQQIAKIKTILSATSAKKGSKAKNNPNVAAAAGGFRRSKTLDKRPLITNDDFAVFPELDDRVKQTIIAAPAASNDTAKSNCLLARGLTPDNDEVYQRLDQIYGFPFFNFDDSRITMNGSFSADGAKSDSSPAVASSLLDMLSATTTSAFLEDDEPRLATESKSTATNLDRSPLPWNLLPPFAKIRVLHMDPLVLAIDEFFTPQECDRYIAASEPKTNTHVLQSRSPTVGKDAAAKAQRTSTTFYHMYHQVPELISKASRLLGIAHIDRWEEPQTVRYRRNERFTWHLDALGPKEQQDSTAGQRVATLLVYLTDLQATDGGATLFRDLGIQQNNSNTYLRVQPVKGSAVLFFPAAGGIVDCPFDIRTLHSGEVVAADAANDKWIAQLWLRQRSYSPTAPPGNRHADAMDSIADFCQRRPAVLMREYSD